MIRCLSALIAVVLLAATFVGGAASGLASAHEHRHGMQHGADGAHVTHGARAPDDIELPSTKPDALDIAMRDGPGSPLDMPCHRDWRRSSCCCTSASTGLPQPATALVAPAHARLSYPAPRHETGPSRHPRPPVPPPRA